MRPKILVATLTYVGIAVGITWLTVSCGGTAEPTGDDRSTGTEEPLTVTSTTAPADGPSRTASTLVIISAQTQPADRADAVDSVDAVGSADSADKADSGGASASASAAASASVSSPSGLAMAPPPPGGQPTGEPAGNSEPGEGRIEEPADGSEPDDELAAPGEHPDGETCDGQRSIDPWSAPRPGSLDADALEGVLARYRAQQCRSEFSSLVYWMAISGQIDEMELEVLIATADEIMDRFHTDENPEFVAADMCQLLLDHLPSERS